MQAIEMKVFDQPTLLDVGTWDATHGLFTQDDLFPHYTGGLRQRTLNVTTLEFPPWQIYQRNDKGKVIGYTGLILEMAKELGNRLNFSINFLEPKDRQWGARLSFTKWTGMVEQVRGENVRILWKVEILASGTDNKMSI